MVENEQFIPLVDSWWSPMGFKGMQGHIASVIYATFECSFLYPHIVTDAVESVRHSRVQRIRHF